MYYGRALASLALSLSVTGAVFAQDWIPVDEIISNPAVSLADPELDEVDNRVAWQLGPNFLVEGLLLVADVDPDNGDFLDPLTGIPISEGGAGLVIDASLVDRSLTGNGPEWALGLDGGQILYSKYNENQEPSLARAQFDGQDWVTELLPTGQNRFTPEGSKDVDDESPRAAYYGFIGGGAEVRLAIRIIDLAFTERVAPVRTRSGNFVPDESAFVTTADAPPGPQQIYLFDYDVDLLDQITFDNGSKQQSPEVWYAPEFGNDLAMVVVAQFPVGGVARIYRRTNPEDNLTWVRMVDIRSPNPDKPFVGAARPFVWEGKSYIVFLAEPMPGATGPGGEVWIAALSRNPMTRFYRKVSEDDDGNQVRFDPESFITTNGPIIYYSQATGGIIVQRRAQTGITPGFEVP